MRQINKATIDLIVEFEGCKLEAYQDHVGVWTIGIGHTSMAGPPKVDPKMCITKERAYEMFRADVVKYAATVEKALTVPVNDNQFGAMVSLCYNVGPGNFLKSSVLKKTNMKDWLGAANSFALWNKAGGKVARGLSRRRQAEANLYLAKVVVEDSPKSVLPDFVPKQPIVVKDTVIVESPLKVEVKPAPVVAPITPAPIIVAANKTDIQKTPDHWLVRLIKLIFGKKDV